MKTDRLDILREIEIEVKTIQAEADIAIMRLDYLIERAQTLGLPEFVEKLKEIKRGLSG
jgi:hypothetical protein